MHLNVNCGTETLTHVLLLYSFHINFIYCPNTNKCSFPFSSTDGNPVTGEGYKSSSDFSTHTPSLNGANQVINKNRIPPGGFSSGLW